MRSHSRFYSFLAGSFGTWEGRAHPLFLVFFWLFPLSCLNPFFTVIHASEITSLLAASEDPDSAFFLCWQFFNLLIWASFLFLSSFLINFRACLLLFFNVFWASSLLGLPFFLFFSWSLVLISLVWVLWFFRPQQTSYEKYTSAKDTSFKGKHFIVQITLLRIRLHPK